MTENVPQGRIMIEPTLRARRTRTMSVAHRTNSEGRLPLRVDLSESEYFALCSIAERRKTTAGNLVADLVARALGAAPASTPARKHRGRLTDQELLRLRRLLEQNVPVPAIAKQLGVSASTVRFHAQRIRMTRGAEGARA